MSTHPARLRARTTTVVATLTLLLAGLAGTVLSAPPAAGTGGGSSTPPFVCTGNTVYSIDQDSRRISRLDSETGAHADNGRFLSGWSDDPVNALALPGAGGRYAYAFNREENAVLRFDAVTDETESWAAPRNDRAQAVVAGAINPVNGLYYYATGGDTWTVYAFDTSTKTPLGKVATVSGTDLGGNGDWAFDARGTLYVVSNDSQHDAGTLVRVDQSLPTTPGSRSLTVTKLTSTPDRSGQYAAMAFDPSGALVIGTASGNLLRVNAASGETISSEHVDLDLSDLASCAVPSTATVRVNLPEGRAASGDQFRVTITGGGLDSGNTGTTEGAEPGVQDQTADEYAGPVVVRPGAAYTITQSGAAGTDPADYTSTWTCVDATSGDTVASGSGTTGSFRTPSTSGATVTCTFTNVPRRPAIELDKSGAAVEDLDGNGHDAGDRIRYTFAVTNTGNLGLGSVQVTDPTLGGAVSCPSATLAAGASFSCSAARYTLTQADLDTGRVDNTATVRGTPPGGPEVSDTDTVRSPLTRAPGIDLDKTAGAVQDLDGNGHDAGDTIRYTFEVSNTGNVTLHNVDLADPRLGGAVYCPATPLAPGETVGCTAVTYPLTQADVNAGKVDNTATVTGEAPGGTEVTDTDSTATGLAGTASLELDKQASAVHDVDGNGHDTGDEIRYRFVVSNTGTVTLDPVTVADPNVGPVTCPDGALAPGASVSCSERTYRLTQADVEAGTVVNTATATGRTPAGALVQATDTTTSTITAEPRIELDKTATGPVDQDGNGPDAGDRLDYGFTVTNTGTVSLHAISVTDPMLGAVSCPTGALGPGASVTCSEEAYVLTQADLDRGRVDNEAAVEGTPSDGDPVTDTDATETPLDPRPAIRLDKEAGPVSDLNGNGPDVGDIVGYTFTVTNTGQATLSTITITDPRIGPVTCPSGSLAPGEQLECAARSYSITDADIDAGAVENTATVTGTTPSGGTVQDRDDARTPLERRTTNLVLTKTVDDERPVAGDTVTYELTVSNTGNATAAAVVLTDVLPAGLTLVRADAPCTTTGGAVGCELGALAAGESRTLHVDARVDELPDPGAVTEHVVDVQKTEAHVDLGPGATRTVSAVCPTGYVVSDGSARIDHVDQGTGTWESVRVTESRATAPDTWTATLVNGATGRAQGKVFAVCVESTTQVAGGHAHDIVTADGESASVALPAGRTDVTLECAPGQVPVRPGYALDGAGLLLGSYPSGSSGWTFSVHQPGPDGTGSFEVDCLATQVAETEGHRHDLALTSVADTVPVPPGEVVEVQLSCGDGKGIVAGYRPEDGLVVLGNDPRPVIRAFRFHNPTDVTLEAKVWLRCLATRTSHGGAPDGSIVNTAEVTTPTEETTTADNTASARLTVGTEGPARAASRIVRVSGVSVRARLRCGAASARCEGRAVLRAQKRQRLGRQRIRKGTVLARASYRLEGGERTTLRLRPTRKGRAALRSERLRVARIVVDGKARVVRIRR